LFTITHTHTHTQRERERERERERNSFHVPDVIRIGQAYTSGTNNTKISTLNSMAYKVISNSYKGHVVTGKQSKAAVLEVTQCSQLF
jgi:hypothetical protein